MKKKKIAIVFGTRPEAIKMAPVILELKKYQDEFESCIIVSAQHREMLDQVLSVFDIKPDYDLDIMKRNQTLSDITSDVLKGIETVFVKEQPDMVLVHGDTTTSFAAALAAYYHQIPIGHVEAGLRTYDKYFPFPEEGNRQLIDAITDLFFVPTETTKQNLLKEGKDEQQIVVTGNTVIDAVRYTKVSKTKHNALDLMDEKTDQKWILLTSHRRENYGQPMINIFEAILEVVNNHKEIEVIVPVHLSPTVQRVANEILGDHDRIHLIEPLEVDVFHQVINKTYLVLTDSGGLQEEAPALDKPVLVLRDKTERPEGLDAGTLKVIGTDKRRIVEEVNELVTNRDLYIKMSQADNPYGDGYASGRILETIKGYFL
ncbi:UDP-N-acetylglucosamine 2-epimerase (non-hydrolysing) [Alkalibacterium putridalgicola]|uniref:UDP-N-acetylglucosamine 2-epimerase (non-hydrolyzing) n=1 Tax=Alkalibacterium putridalgicola TaxID=426703 RepID=A0A1H7QKR3_9LACT|nr:UDP-N-acetylglucosamine 2-epimerase (non-hydrolyzing) [Alkalibacterium putridalgicola]GEK88420.1 UDP-N-acetyl glucosamine 2-epimerase [Alkalibacterium putridalgicola]SEL48710.1 UDP-N-acetylglucosamine 2-epimerase (non-hydrolysing) [Alkalibacterium putridalgicola]